MRLVVSSPAQSFWRVLCALRNWLAEFRIAGFRAITPQVGAVAPTGDLGVRIAGPYRSWLSLPLLTALAASVSIVLLVTDVLFGGGRTASPALAAAPSAQSPKVTTQPITVADTSIGQAAENASSNNQASFSLPSGTSFVPEFLLDGAMEPAAGPENLDDTDQQVATAEVATSLPAVPEAPPGLEDIAIELKRRRAEILELEANLALREAAVRAAEADLESELQRLEAFRDEIEGLIGEADAAEEARLDQLVKMYESMRSKNAAAIFDRLDLSVILAVGKRMREAKMAAILAAMDPNRAQVVTTEMARERTLPQLD